MIVVHLSGGLGNQLFQYATARRAAAVHGAKLLMDVSWFNASHTNVTPRKYELSKYAIAARIISKRDVLFPALYTNRVMKRLPLPRPLRLVREKSFSFEQELLTLPDNIYLDGYWQSPKYFEDIREILLEELRPASPMSVLDERTARQIAESNAVSVHVRRGDYVNLASAAQTHGVCSVEYYQAAVCLLQERVREPTFFVFSDDPEWAMANLHFDSPTIFVNHNNPESAFQDMRLMSLCEHQIIANSSFSWWAAWLNRNPNKIVLAPEKWFASGSNITKDLYPTAWIKV